MSERLSPPKKNSHPVSIKLTAKIDKKVAAAVAATNLKRPDILRMSIERGVDVLLAQLKSKPNTAA